MLLAAPSPRKGQSPPEVLKSGRRASKGDSNLNLTIPAKSPMVGSPPQAQPTRRNSTSNVKYINSDQRQMEPKKSVTNSPGTHTKNMLKKSLSKKILYLKFLKKMGNSFYSSNKQVLASQASPDNRKRNAMKSPDSSKNKKVVFVSLNMQFDLTLSV